MKSMRLLGVALFLLGISGMLYMFYLESPALALFLTFITILAIGSILVVGEF